MLFTSGSFFVLVALTFAAFYLPGLRRTQTIILIISSFIFYGLNQFSYLLLLLASIGINAFTSHAAFFAKDMRRARFWMILGICANLAILAFFKYSGLLAHSLPAHLTAADQPAHFLLLITLPVGISFFTFEGISLLVDSYRTRDSESYFGNKLTNSRQHLLSTTLFVSFFPHLVAGPILKAHDFFPQITTKSFRDIDWEFCFRKMTVGYFLKMVVADGLKEHTFWIRYPYFMSMPSGDLLWMLFGYSMQIFADFAGYSLIAIGVAGLFGYRLPENFDFPYISESFSEFWRRWHISLSTWLKEYLYFPLGGNRKGPVRTYVNLFIVMFLGGLWHGAAWSYAIWGSVHGLALAIERFIGGRFKPAPNAGLRALKILLVFVVVTAAWLLFKLPNFTDVMRYVAAISRNWNKPANMSNVYNLMLLSLPVVVYHVLYLARGAIKGAATWTPRRLAMPLAYGAMIFLIVANSGSSGEFIYFQF